ncbi:zwei Ig domain protein zig-8-like isoform X1 [Macrobrachium nipponense]|uniref:zwei Ig domain protein zig-8-like isoform X1 n=2 Tax=Macrobrachium nipponense TaxID=159736 RepID=UPI0030C7C500
MLKHFGKLNSLSLKMLRQYQTLWLVATALTSLVLPSLAGSKKQHESSREVIVSVDPVWNIRHVLPPLDLQNNSVTDVKVNVGDVAYLPCRFPRVSSMHLVEVSWIRRSDWHILTTGTYSYTSDVRFNVLHKEGSDDWTLQLKYVDTRDNGTYECQSSTGTGVMSKYVNLHVSKPRATIHGPTELHVQEGETVSLICVIQQSKPPFVFWYHGIILVNNEDERSRFDVDTMVEKGKTTSSLTIKEARYDDSGNYSCLPPHVDPASVMVYVTKGDEAAAVHRRGASSGISVKPSSASFILAIFVIFKISIPRILSDR